MPARAQDLVQHVRSTASAFDPFVMTTTAKILSLQLLHALGTHPRPDHTLTLRLYVHWRTRALSSVSSHPFDLVGQAFYMLYFCYSSPRTALLASIAEARVKSCRLLCREDTIFQYPGIEVDIKLALPRRSPTAGCMQACVTCIMS